MQMFTIPNKRVTNVAYLQDQLLANGFTGAIPSSQGSTPPKVYVYENDGAPNPTAFVNTYVDPNVITLSSNAPIGSFGLPQVAPDGVATQTITVRMKDPYTGQNVNESLTVVVAPSFPITVIPTTVAVVNGVGSFVVGPTTVAGRYNITVRRQGDTQGWSQVAIMIAFA